MMKQSFLVLSGPSWVLIDEHDTPIEFEHTPITLPTEALLTKCRRVANTSSATEISGTC